MFRYETLVFKAPNSTVHMVIILFNANSLVQYTIAVLTKETDLLNEISRCPFKPNALKIGHRNPNGSLKYF